MFLIFVYFQLRNKSPTTSNLLRCTGSRGKRHPNLRALNRSHSKPPPFLLLRHLTTPTTAPASTVKFRPLKRERSPYFLASPFTESTLRPSRGPGGITIALKKSGVDEGEELVSSSGGAGGGRRRARNNNKNGSKIRRQPCIFWELKTAKQDNRTVGIPTSMYARCLLA